MNIAIIYHIADFDGKLSNEVCRYHLRERFPSASIRSYGWDYGRPLPTNNDGSAISWEDYDEIYIVDLSVDELMAQSNLRFKIIWIDHHKSAIEKWDLANSNFDRLRGIRIDGVAACRLCWSWFTRLNTNTVTYTRPATKQDFVDRIVDEPYLIRLAGEYDIWDHRDSNAKILQFGLRSLDDAAFQTLVEEQFKNTSAAGTLLSSCIITGDNIKKYCDKQNYEYSATFSRTLDWEGLSFCCLNIGQRGNSDLLLGGIKPHHDACFAWRDEGRAVIVSLYHIAGKTDIDLSLIAVKYGGGGHKGACGFKLSLEKLSQILSK